jgi:hypothetical protein
MAKAKKQGKVMDEIEELYDMVDALTEDVDRLFKDLYVDPLEEKEDINHNICGVPDEVFKYMEENCTSMFMGIS